MQLVVFATEPRPGRVKTRLCPPCSYEEAAHIAEAGLADTLATVADTPAQRRVLALDGMPGPWLPEGFDVIQQRGRGLDQRLTAVFADCFATMPDEPVVVVGADTPHVTRVQLEDAAARLGAGVLRRRRNDDTNDGVRSGSCDGVPSLRREAADAVLGPAPDGGYWLIGLRHLQPGAIRGVPMSVRQTYVRQYERLAACGYRMAIADELMEVDTAAEALAVAATIPTSHFADAVHRVLGSQQAA